MPIDRHPGDEEIEQYCLGGTLAEDELAAIEEHVLVCTACQDRIRQNDDYIKAMRSAAAALEREKSKPKSRERLWILRPVPLAAAAGLAALVLLWVAGPAIRHQGQVAPVAVLLQATRGPDASVRAHAPALTPLVLELDLAGVPELRSYRVEVVDFSGRPVFQGSASADKSRLKVATPDRMASGDYWVRVYDPAASSRLLREYGLALERK